jgi:hypothetical protein
MRTDGLTAILTDAPQGEERARAQNSVARTFRMAVLVSF